MEIQCLQSIATVHHVARITYKYLRQELYGSTGFVSADPGSRRSRYMLTSIAFWAIIKASTNYGWSLLVDLFVHIIFFQFSFLIFLISQACFPFPSYSWRWVVYLYQPSSLCLGRRLQTLNMGDRSEEVYVISSLTAAEDVDQDPWVEKVYS